MYLGALSARSTFASGPCRQEIYLRSDFHKPLYALLLIRSLSRHHPDTARTAKCTLISIAPYQLDLDA